MINQWLKRIKSEQKPFRFILSRILWISKLCPFFTIKRSGYRLRFFPTALSASLFCYQDYGLEDEKLINKLLSPGDTFIDVGANIGHLTLCAAHAVGASGKVYSFEAHPITFQFLTKNINFNSKSNILAYNLGIGKQPGTLTITSNRSDDQNRILEQQKSNVGQKIKVETLDNIIDKKNIKLIKIDTEGFEKYVFEGAKNLLLKTDYIYFECNDELFNKYDYTDKELFAHLHKYNFEIYTYNNNSLQLVLNANLKGHINLLAINRNILKTQAFDLPQQAP